MYAPNIPISLLMMNSCIYYKYPDKKARWVE